MFTMTLKTSNAAFCDEETHGADEVSRILAEVAAKIAGGDFEGVCRDYNGNAVGAFALTAG